MRKALGTLALLLALNTGIALAPVSIADSPRSYQFASAPQSTLLYTAQILKDGRVIASGFHVGDGVVVTARHVISSPKEAFNIRFRLKDHKGEFTTGARVLEVSHNYDAALLWADLPSKIPAAKIASESAEYGDPVIVSGNPAGVQTIPTAGFYVGESRRRMGDFPPVLLVSCQAYFGNSGGPVVNMISGEVIGILVGGMTGYHQLSLVTDIQKVRGMIAKAQRDRDNDIEE